MNLKIKLLAALAIAGNLFISCQKELVSKENNENVFKSSEAFKDYLQTLDVSKREEAIKKYVRLPSEKPNTVRVFLNERAHSKLTPSIDCEAVTPEQAESWETQDAYERFNQSQYMGYFQATIIVQWTLAKNYFNLWHVDSEETITISQSLSGPAYYISNALHGGSNLWTVYNCSLPISFSETIHTFVPSTFDEGTTMVTSTVTGSFSAFSVSNTLSATATITL